MITVIGILIITLFGVATAVRKNKKAKESKNKKIIEEQMTSIGQIRIEEKERKERDKEKKKDKGQMMNGTDNNKLHITSKTINNIGD